MSSDDNKDFKASESTVKVDFYTFVTSLYTSALMHLGEIPDPRSNKTNLEPEMGRQNIDILEMLEEKTRNNLDENEQNLIKSALYDLRMKFVELSKKKG